MIYIKNGEKCSDRDQILRILYRGDQLRSNVQTYSDSKCTVLQCSENKRRSVRNIHQLFLTYFPETTMKNTIESILSYVNMAGAGGKHPYRSYLTFLYCPNIHRIVVNRTSTPIHSNRTSEDADDMCIQDYLDIADSKFTKEFRRTLPVKSFTRVKELVNSPFPYFANNVYIPTWGPGRTETITTKIRHTI